MSRPRTRILLACQRCRRRKQKCDGKLPSCGACAQAGERCLTKDRLTSAADASNRQLPRGYIEALEEKVKTLERAVSAAQARQGDGDSHAPPSIARSQSRESTVRGEDKEGDDCAIHDIGSEIDFLSLNAMAETNKASTNGTAVPFGLSHIVKAAIETDNSDPTTSKRSNPSFQVLASCLPSVLPNMVAKLPRETALVHLDHYFRYVHLSYPFLHHSTILRYYDQVASTTFPTTLHQKIQSVLVHVVLAIGILVPDHMAHHGSFFANHFFLVANQYLEDVFSVDNVETTQALLLLAVFSLFSPCGGSTWHFVALAMRRCISLGFHRKLSSNAMKKLSPFDNEQIKWLFWSTYTIDRFVSNALGRPYAIADVDIDIQYPQAHDGAPGSSPIWFPERPHVDASGLHMFRYTGLVSSLNKSSGLSHDQELLEQLKQWKEEIPDIVAVNDGISTDYFESLYWQAWLVPLLRRPSDIAEIDEAKLERIAEAAVNVIDSFHRRSKKGLFISWLMGCTTFNAGIIIIYCLQSLPAVRANLPYAKFTADLAACSHILTTLASGWDFMKAYRDLFDALAEMLKRQVESERTGTPMPLGDMAVLDTSFITNRSIRTLTDDVRMNVQLTEMSFTENNP